VIRLDIRADIKEAQRYCSNLQKNAVRKAGARAINDVIITVRAEGAREIKKAHPALAIGAIKNAMLMRKANRLTLVGSVDTEGRPQTLLLFKPSGGDRPVRFRKTRTAGIYNATRAAVARPLTAMIGTKRSVMQYKGRKAFRIAKYGNEIFVRRNGSGRQVRRLRGPSLPGVFRAQYARFQAIAQQRWAAAFRSRMQYEIELAKKA